MRSSMNWSSLNHQAAAHLFSGCGWSKVWWVHRTQVHSEELSLWDEHQFKQVQQWLREETLQRRAVREDLIIIMEIEGLGCLWDHIMFWLWNYRWNVSFTCSLKCQKQLHNNDHLQTSFSNNHGPVCARKSLTQLVWRSVILIFFIYYYSLYYFFEWDFIFIFAVYIFSFIFRNFIMCFCYFIL